MVTREDIGQRVRGSSGRVGILRDVDPVWEDPSDPPGERRKRPTAFVWPEGGGREWAVSPDAVTRAE